MDFIALGTGTSSQVPTIACLTDPEHGCLCCLDSRRNAIDGAGGLRNQRRNTSAAIRVLDPTTGESHNIIIDAGKSFYAAACTWFPKHGLRRIDALLLTHAHADAAMLDDLRSWTLHGIVQESMDVYLDQATYDSISITFPYLVSAAAATGGGDLPDLRWHVIEPDVPLKLFGVEILPLRVEHGAYFGGRKGQPFWCLSFLFDRSLLYVSDVSVVPQDTLDTLDRLIPAGKLPVLIVDCLRIGRHASHFGAGQAVALARLLRPTRTYLTGFAHQTTHADWVAFGRAIESGRRAAKPRPTDVDDAERIRRQWACAKATGTGDVRTHDPEAFTERALEEVEDWVVDPKDHEIRCWVRPAYDGLLVRIDGNQVSSDADAPN